jgi:FlaA1/EpsC-like NDP-sugar epimerase
MEITYESILERSAIISHLDLNLVKILDAERILITGAGGSVGSKICLLLSSFENVNLLATDRDENRLHSLSLDVMGSALFNSPAYRVLDVRDKTGVENIISWYKPTMIIHAAALKHLAILEQQPREAYLTNFLGTKNLLLAAAKFNVQRFLNISTDKAANPISILGKTKYMAEILTSYFRSKGHENYTSVRFGNVFNSKGSVIETFTHQIMDGLSVTLTDEKVERFFMKIEEAASLSIIAAILNAGDVHILDMGKPIRLKHVIEKLMKTLGKTSTIEIVGLRQGEKITEELWSPNEHPFPTAHSKISAVKLDKNLINLSDIIEKISDDRDALIQIKKFLSLA